MGEAIKTTIYIFFSNSLPLASACAPLMQGASRVLSAPAGLCFPGPYKTCYAAFTVNLLELVTLEKSS